MGKINTIVIEGNLTRNAELKHLPTGTALCAFSIAHNKVYKSQGTKKETVSYFDVIIWGKMGESLQQYLTIGKRIAVTGELEQDRWEKDGSKRSRVKIVCRDLHFIGGKQDETKASESFKDDPEIPF